MDKLRMLKDYKKDDVAFIYNSQEISGNDTLQTINYKKGETVDVCYR